MSQANDNQEITIEGDGIFVPCFEMVSCPTVRLDEIKSRRFYIVDRAQIACREAIQAEDDAYILGSIPRHTFGAGMVKVELVGMMELSVPDEPIWGAIIVDRLVTIQPMDNLHFDVYIKELKDKLLASLSLKNDYVEPDEHLSSRMINWQDTLIRDDTQQKSIWMQLHEKGVMSSTSLMEKFCLDYDQEVERLRYETAMQSMQNLEDTVASCFSSDGDGQIAVDTDPEPTKDYSQPQFYSPLHTAQNYPYRSPFSMEDGAQR